MSLFDLLGNKATLSQIQTLLETSDVDINALDHAGETVLYVASCGKYGSGTKNVDVMKLLLQHGANVNAIGRSHGRVLYYCNDVEVMKVLIQHGADVNCARVYDGQKITVLARLLESCFEPLRLRKMRLLVAAGADVNCIIGDYQVQSVVYNTDDRQALKQQSLLHRALYFKRETTAVILIAAGATVDDRAYSLMVRANIDAPSEQTLRKERKLIERARWKLVLPRVLQICIALHTLQISVLEMIEVLEFAVPVFYLLTAHKQWRMVMFIRHWTINNVINEEDDDDEQQRKKRRRQRK